MKITTRLHLTLGSAVAGALLFMAFASWSATSYLRLAALDDQVGAALQQLARLQVKTFDHLINRTARTTLQWTGMHASLAASVNAIGHDDPGAVALVRQVGKRLADMRYAFEQLNEARRADPVPTTDSLLGQVWVNHLAAQFEEAVRLLGDLERHGSTTQEDLALLISLSTVALLGILLLLAAVNAWWLLNTVIRPLERLMLATRRLAEGDMQARTGIRREDEFGDLAQALDEMAARRQEIERELLRSNTELEQFAHVAAHDLQEPLRSIASFLQLIERRYADKVDDDGREYIRFSVDAATRLQRMVRALLDYAHLDADRSTFEQVDLAQLLAKVLGELEVAIHETGATFSFDPLPTLPADRSQLQRLLQNLLENSLKYRAPDRPLQVHVGAVRIEEAVVSIPEDPVRPGWLLWVGDNGVGIEPRHAERVFKLFQRLDPADSPPGTGIGLTICRRIVERHKGLIWCESNEPCGTVIYFTFPDGQPQTHRDAAA